MRQAVRAGADPQECDASELVEYLLVECVVAAVVGDLDEIVGTVSLYSLAQGAHVVLEARHLRFGELHVAREEELTPAVPEPEDDALEIHCRPRPACRVQR